jgi:hypothetical protein
MKNLKTQFDIGDIIQYKFEHPEEGSLSGFVVMEIIVQICNAGVQTNYFCRPVFAKDVNHLYNKHRSKDSEKKSPEYIIAHGTGKDLSDIGWKKYREDELIPASNDLKTLLKFK